MEAVRASTETPADILEGAAAASTLQRPVQEADALEQDGGVAKLDAANVIDETDELSSGDEAELTVTLEAGSYLLLCNLPGHYQSGQVVAFTVT